VAAELKRLAKEEKKLVAAVESGDGAIASLTLPAGQPGA